MEPGFPCGNPKNGYHPKRRTQGDLSKRLRQSRGTPCRRRRRRLVDVIWHWKIGRASVACWALGFGCFPKGRCLWVWLKIKELGLRGFLSLVPFTMVPFWYHSFEPQPHRGTLQTGGRLLVSPSSQNRAPSKTQPSAGFCRRVGSACMARLQTREHPCCSAECFFTDRSQKRLMMDPFW